MNTWSFLIGAPIMGAVRTTRMQKWVDPRYKRYEQYKARVRILANLARVPSELKKGAKYQVTVAVNWKGAARVDLDNVVKGLLDALWKQDRRVLSIHATANEKAGIEGAHVEIDWVL